MQLNGARNVPAKMMAAFDFVARTTKQSIVNIEPLVVNSNLPDQAKAKILSSWP